MPYSQSATPWAGKPGTHDARVIRLSSEYDWYHDEIKALTDLQKVQKRSAKRLFDESVRRQVRRGGRLALVVDLEVPQSTDRVGDCRLPALRGLHRFAWPQGSNGLPAGPDDAIIESGNRSRRLQHDGP